MSTTSVPAGDQPELIVLTKASAGVRALQDGVASVTGADTTSLSSILASHGATIQPYSVQAKTAYARKLLRLQFPQLRTETLPARPSRIFLFSIG